MEAKNAFPKVRQVVRRSPCACSHFKVLGRGSGWFVVVTHLIWEAWACRARESSHQRSCCSAACVVGRPYNYLGRKGAGAAFPACRRASPVPLQAAAAVGRRRNSREPMRAHERDPERRSSMEKMRHKVTMARRETIKREEQAPVLSRAHRGVSTRARSLRCLRGVEMWPSHLPSSSTANSYDMLIPARAGAGEASDWIPGLRDRWWR